MQLRLKCDIYMKKYFDKINEKNINKCFLVGKDEIKIQEIKIRCIY